jgi:predicted HTH domain antitoxin
MKTVTIELAPPVDRLVEHWARSEQISPEQAAQELIALGFEARLRELYARYRRAECSFGYLAEALGMTTWELAHLLEERRWVAHNLPS